MKRSDDAVTRRGRSTEGFSLVEALIGVAVAGIALVPVIEMQSQAVRQYQRQVMLEQRLLAQRNGLVVLGDINIMAEPTGRRELTQGQSLSWTATPLTARTRTLRFLGGEGDFEVALFEVQAEIRARRQSLASFRVERLGWQRLTES